VFTVRDQAALAAELEARLASFIDSTWVRLDRVTA
jgi:hypothetical protein